MNQSAGEDELKNFILILYEFGISFFITLRLRQKEWYPVCRLGVLTYQNKIRTIEDPEHKQDVVDGKEDVLIGCILDKHPSLTLSNISLTE